MDLVIQPLLMVAGVFVAFGMVGLLRSIASWPKARIRNRIQQQPDPEDNEPPAGAVALIIWFLRNTTRRTKTSTHNGDSDTQQWPDPAPEDYEPLAPAGIRLYPMAIALIGWLLVAVGLAVAAGYGIYRIVGRPHLPATYAFSVSELLDLLKIGLAVVAGFGGVVALTVTHRKQRVAEASHELAHQQEARERRKLFDDRYVSASEQLGHTKFPVRLAGVYAMVSPADDWPHRRQNCVDVLCGYLRSPYPAGDGNEREVRQAAMNSLLDRLGGTRWQQGGRISMDFRGAEFHELDLSQRTFRGAVKFDGAVLRGELTDFRKAVFRHGASFDNTRFESTKVDFTDTQFLRAASFADARFDGAISFTGALFSQTVSFRKARFTGPSVSLREAVLRGVVTFETSTMDGTALDLRETFADAADLTFDAARITGTSIDLSEFISVRSVISFNQAEFDTVSLIGMNTSFVKPDRLFGSTCGLTFRNLAATDSRIEFVDLDIVNGELILSGANLTDSTVRLTGSLDNSAVGRAGMTLTNSELDHLALTTRAWADDTKPHSPRPGFRELDQ